MFVEGEIRNDLYLVLCSGDFDRGSKKAAKNIEVMVTVFDSDNKEIPVSGMLSWKREFKAPHCPVLKYHANLLRVRD